MMMTTLIDLLFIPSLRMERPCKTVLERLLSFPRKLISQANILPHLKIFKLIDGPFESGDGASLALLDFDPIKLQTGDAALDSCVLYPTFLDSSFHVILSALELKFGRSLTDVYVATSCRSLVELDEADFGMHPQALRYWDNLLSLMSSTSFRLVWLQKRDTLGHSVVRNLSRVARAEDPSLEMTILKVPTSYATRHVQDSIQYAFKTSMEGEELEIQEGCLLLPRIEADKTLTSRYI